MVTDAILDEKIELLEKQKMDHFAVYHQAVGAISVLKHLKEYPKKDHITTEELGEMTGGRVESIDPV